MLLVYTNIIIIVTIQIQLKINRWGVVYLIMENLKNTFYLEVNNDLIECDPSNSISDDWSGNDLPVKSWSFTTDIEGDNEKLYSLIKDFEPEYLATIEFKYGSIKANSKYKKLYNYKKWREKIKGKQYARPIYIMKESLEFIANKPDVSILDNGDKLEFTTTIKAVN